MSARERARSEERLGWTRISFKARENVNKGSKAFGWKARQRRGKLELWWEYLNFLFPTSFSFSVHSFFFFFSSLYILVKIVCWLRMVYWWMVMMLVGNLLKWSMLFHFSLFPILPSNWMRFKFFMNCEVKAL